MIYSEVKIIALQEEGYRQAEIDELERSIDVIRAAHAPLIGFWQARSETGAMDVDEAARNILVLEEMCNTEIALLEQRIEELKDEQ